MLWIGSCVSARIKHKEDFVLHRKKAVDDATAFYCLRNTCDFIQFSVSEIQQNIRCDHSQIQEIEKQHLPFFAEGCHIGFDH